MKFTFTLITVCHTHKKKQEQHILYKPSTQKLTFSWICAFKINLMQSRTKFQYKYKCKWKWASIVSKNHLHIKVVKVPF